MLKRLFDWIAKKQGYAKVYYKDGRIVFDGQNCVEVAVPAAYRDEFMTDLMARHAIVNFHFRYSEDVPLEIPSHDILYSGCVLF